MNYRNEWLNACFGKVKHEESITAIFKGGRKISFPISTMELLKTDPQVVTIYSNETGEVYFDRD